MSGQALTASRSRNVTSRGGNPARRGFRGRGEPDTPEHRANLRVGYGRISVQCGAGACSPPAAAPLVTARRVPRANPIRTIPALPPYLPFPAARGLEVERPLDLQRFVPGLDGERAAPFPHPSHEAERAFRRPRTGDVKRLVVRQIEPAGPFLVLGAFRQNPRLQACDGLDHERGAAPGQRRVYLAGGGAGRDRHFVHGHDGPGVGHGRGPMQGDAHPALSVAKLPEQRARATVRGQAGRVQVERATRGEREPACGQDAGETGDDAEIGRAAPEPLPRPLLARLVERDHRQPVRRHDARQVLPPRNRDHRGNRATRGRRGGPGSAVPSQRHRGDAHPGREQALHDDRREGARTAEHENLHHPGALWFRTRSGRMESARGRTSRPRRRGRGCRCGIDTSEIRRYSRAFIRIPSSLR